MLTDALVTHTCGGPFTFQRVRLIDNLRADECLVRVRASGVCHTDLSFANESSMPDMFPVVLCHEGCGTVVQVGSRISRVIPGYNVILCFSCCGKCKHCLHKQTAYCDLCSQYNFGVGRLDGTKVYSDLNRGVDGKRTRIVGHFFSQSSFAKHVVVSERGLVVVPDYASTSAWHTLAPLGCGIMTGAGAMLNVVQPTAEMNVVVAGVGAVGMSAVMAQGLLPEHNRPRRVIAIDVLPERLQLARKYGATHGVNAKLRPHLTDVLMDITRGKGVNGAIDTTGNVQVVEDLVQSAAKKGKVVAVGVGRLDAKVPIGTFEAVKAGLVYVGCNQGNAYPQNSLPLSLRANAVGNFPSTVPYYRPFQGVPVAT